LTFNLESWIHHNIKASGIVNSESPISRDCVQAYDDFRLREVVRYCFERSAFYRDLFRAAGLEPDRVRGTADLGRIPFTEPEHIAENPFRFLCTSQAEVARPYTFVTSGTSGPQKRIFWTPGDLGRIVAFMTAGIGTVADAGDTVLILLPDGRPYSQSDLLKRGVQGLGATPVVADIDLSARELLKTIEETRCAVVFGYTRKLFRLTQELRKQVDLRRLSVNILFLAAEYVPDAMRHEFQSAWGCGVRTHYGLTEMGLGVAVECEAGDGYHFNEADLLLEIIDPQSGEPVPDGEEGELVFTTLTREAMPLIRYRTHDISRRIPGPCSCGATSLLKIGKVKKRLENIVRVAGGDEVYPALFDDLLFEIPGLVDYQVILTKEEGKDRMDFKIEMQEGPASLAAIKEALSSAPILSRNISRGTMVEPRIELAPPGALRTVSREKKMILDRRAPE